ncbi:hypothetical protein HNV12_10280 [Methanococcoides sp. SA1]|nr:hypothetical protein [Methanococcoides sp. SA1]
MKKLLYTVLVTILISTAAFGNNVAVNVYEEVPTVLVDAKEENLDTRIMYAFVKLYQENNNFDLGQVIVKLDNEDAEDVKVLVRKSDLEKLVNRDVEYKTFIKEFAKFM